MRAAAVQLTATADRDRNLDTADRLTCVLDRAPRVEADPEADRRRLWEELAPAAGTPAP